MEESGGWGGGVHPGSTSESVACSLGDLWSNNGILRCGPSLSRAGTSEQTCVGLVCLFVRSFFLLQSAFPHSLGAAQ